MPENQATQYITISVAEYHYLTKAAVSATIQDMRRTAEAGAAE